MNNIFNSKKIYSSPSTYLTIEYEYRRVGADMQYRIHYKLWISSASWYSNNISLKFYLNGSNVFSRNCKSSNNGWSFEDTTGWYTVSNKTSGTTSFYVTAKDTQNSSWVNFTSNTYGLYVAPAYTTINTFNVSKISGYSGLTSVKVDWSTAHTIDYLWYSTDNGSTWTGYNVTDGTSGSFNISNLVPNTGYNFKIRVRRKDSQLTTNSGANYQSTYNINYISSDIPNINNGSELIVTASNPSGATCRIRLETIINNQTVSRITKDGVNATFSVNEINSLLQYAPNSSSFTLRVVADTLNGSTVGYNSYKDGIYTIINSNPIFDNFEFLDSDSNIVNVTGNNQLIVRNKSNLRVKISSLNKMIAQNESTPVRYDITAGNRSGSVDYSNSDTYLDLGTINVSGNVTINVNAVDSRGFKTLKSININVLDYFEPTLNTILGRINNFENNTSILSNGIFAPVSNKNSITGVFYRYKSKSIANWDNINWVSFNVTENNEEYFTDSKNIILDNQTSFDFQVKVCDRITPIGIVVDYELDEGIPIGFINATRKNMGIGCLNDDGEEYSLKVLNSITAGTNIKTNGNFVMPSGNIVLDYDVIDTW